MNPLNGIVALKDSLGLTADQVDRLKPLADSLQARNTKIAAEMQKEFQNAGANPDMAALMGRMRPRSEEMQKNSVEALKVAQTILTPEQWAKVPERLRTPRAGFGGPGAQGGGRRRPPQE
jgi:hypothetical protein